MDVITFASAKKASERHTEDYVGETLKGAGFVKGKSVYEIAVDNGYTGSEKQWLEDLKGETGPQGPQGPQGPIGPQGIQGPKGQDGATPYIKDGNWWIGDKDTGIGVGTGGGGGPVEWENIKNRPFYDTRELIHYSQAENPNPVSFDLDQFNLSFYKIFDIVPTTDEMFNAVITVNGSKLEKFSASNISIETDKLFIIEEPNGYAFCVRNYSGELTLPYGEYTVTVPEGETGVYMIRPKGKGMSDIKSIEAAVSGELKQIDKKYLPEGMAYGYETKLFEDIIWDGNTDGLTPVGFNFSPEEGIIINQQWYKVSDKVLSKDDYTGSTIELLSPEGTQESIIEDGYNESTDFGTNGSFFIDEAYVVNVVVDNDTIDLIDLIGIEQTITFPEKGIWFAVASQNGMAMQTRKLLAGTNITKIGSKYLPIGETFGVAGLDGNGKIPQNQINTIDNVQEYNYNPISSNAIYFALDKRSQLKFDSSPMSGSQNPVTSDGIYQAIEDSRVAVDLSVQNGSSNAVSGGAIYNALLKKQDKLYFDDAPISGSNNLVTSGNIYTAIKNKEINVDQTVQSSSNNAVSGSAVYNALSSYYTKNEVDNLLGDVETILNEIDTLIGE